MMESEHKKRIAREFRGKIDLPPVHVLEIPDQYEFMDPELVELLTERIDSYL